jgi:putative peptide zinc metalloprotease protein
LQVLGQLIAGASIAGMVVKPCWDFWKFISIPGRMEQVKRPNLLATVAVLTCLVVGVLLIPLPRRVACSLEIRPRDAAAVYVDVPGRLKEVLVRPGDEVREGQTLARLSNTDLPLQIEELTGQLEENRAKLESLNRQRFKDQRAGEELAQVKEQIAAIEEQLEDKRDELSRLELTAPKAGIVIPAAKEKEPPQERSSLKKWAGSLLDGRNLGATLKESVQFCDIGDPREVEAVLVIDQSDIELVAKDQFVYLKLEAYPGRTFTGEIAEIAQGDLKVAPRSLSSQQGGDLATRTDSAGVQRPLSTSYTARVPLDHTDGLQIGLRGHGLVHTGYQPLGGRIWRYLAHTFHFML